MEILLLFLGALLAAAAALWLWGEPRRASSWIAALIAFFLFLTHGSVSVSVRFRGGFPVLALTSSLAVLLLAHARFPSSRRDLLLLALGGVLAGLAVAVPPFAWLAPLAFLWVVAAAPCGTRIRPMIVLGLALLVGGWVGPHLSPPAEDLSAVALGTHGRLAGWTLLDVAPYRWTAPESLRPALSLLLGRLNGGLTILFLMSSFAALAALNANVRKILPLRKQDLFLILAAWTLTLGAAFDPRVPPFHYVGAALLQIASCAAVSRLLWRRLVEKTGAEILIAFPILLYCLTGPSPIWEKIAVELHLSPPGSLHHDASGAARE
ncbi:MAG: hypothetical protein V2A58_17850 [Planctomycetota bacterium]